MYKNFNYADVLAVSTRAAWTIDDVLPDTARLDFEHDFLPEALARTGAAPGLTRSEQRVLNHIRAHEYLSIFGIVEEFIVPFVLDHARPQLNGDDVRVRALLNFVDEETKHIELFRRFHRRFTADFTTPCAVIGPAAAIGAEVLRHDPLAVALLILHIEWMTQAHYLDSVRNDAALDPLFKSLLRHHWIEEAQHAKLDTLIVEALAAGQDAAGIDRAVDDYFALARLLDEGFAAQTGFNLDALEAASNRKFTAEAREALHSQQHQALRWTYIGSGIVHPQFKATLAAISPAAADAVAAVAPNFC